jgi:hypothetical protein
MDESPGRQGFCGPQPTGWVPEAVPVPDAVTAVPYVALRKLRHSKWAVVFDSASMFLSRTCWPGVVSRLRNATDSYHVQLNCQSPDDLISFVFKGFGCLNLNGNMKS